MPYEATTAFRWTERAFHLIESGGIQTGVVVGEGVVTATVGGPCPRCGHQFVDRQVGQAVTAVRGGHGRDPLPRTVVIDVSCGCGELHAGAPGEVTGCGVAFRVQLVLDAGSDAARPDEASP
ncbi:hypothetical protein [Streptomyces sp. NBC_01451]|uniref:hypothetical protein n=1 Tax=Streptomyces sp. NBC_01451 TaxID=2903872 RepID=UPI002E369022|nr:hypothetical protein [Streptomyces sp. NBC_01451]